MTINGPEFKAYPNIQTHLGTPHFGLQHYEGTILRADVRPLNKSQLEQALDAMTFNDPQRRQFAEKLHAANTALLKTNKKIAIVLDGYSNSSAEGYLGDMIEASRLVYALRTSGKNVTIVTPHADLFQGTTDKAINLIPLPEGTRGSHIPPWAPELLTYLSEAIGDTPCIFPMNANTPAFLKLGKNGMVRNQESLMLSAQAFRMGPRGTYITPNMWSRVGIHQLQAIQITANLLGLEKTNEWREFPKAFLHPTIQAQEVAKTVVRAYGCFDCGEERKECPPLYIHPGTAINGSKLTTKFYPEDKWLDVIRKLAHAEYASNSLTFLEPTDPAQGAMTLRLATTAVDAGLRVAKVPMAQVKTRYGWSLGSFIAFLQELSKHRGIIVGCDSMPAGHAGPATRNPAIVLAGNFDPGFYGPADKALVVLPSKGNFTSGVDADRVVTAIEYLCIDPDLQYQH